MSSLQLMNPEHFMNPEYMLPLMPGEPLHFGYSPTEEDVAFRFPVDDRKHIFPHHFRVRRETMRLEQLINCIRKMMLYPTNDIAICMDRNLDSMYAPLLYRTNGILMQSDYGYADILVYVSADAKNDAYLVEVNRYSGNRELFSRFYQTFKYYVEQGGAVSPSIRVHCGKVYDTDCGKHSGKVYSYDSFDC